MRWLITQDLHQSGQKWKLLTVAAQEHRPDWVFITGDILPKSPDMFRDQERFFKPLRRYLETMKQAGVRDVFTYFGNDDAHPLQPLLDDLDRDGLCWNMNQRVLKRDGLVIVGMNRCRDYPFGYKHWCHPDWDFITCPQQLMRPVTITFDGHWIEIAGFEAHMREKPSLAELLNDLVREVGDDMPRSIWLIHQPPDRLGMDICGHGERVGSPAVREFIEKQQPLLTMHGHIHESPMQPGGAWRATVGRTTVLQPGQIGHRLHYVLAEVNDGVIEDVKWQT